jgi:predicted ribosome quality control (RQC) complex YloA/Tae2 family protein
MVITDDTYENNLILVGQNADENDRLIKESKQNDLWFHLANFPSCHLVIKNTKKHPVDKEMITYCAELCKTNTKYKNIASVTVHYCDIKQVKRTNVKGLVELKGYVDSIIV